MAERIHLSRDKRLGRDPAANGWMPKGPGKRRDVLEILYDAVIHPDGHVSIVRPRQGIRPGKLRLLRILEKEDYLRWLAIRDCPADGTVTAVYAITLSGRKAAVELAGEADTETRLTRRP
jgi:hypothetical protein